MSLEEAKDFCNLADLRKYFGNVSWAWRNWIPVGHITLLAGETGIGKSWLMACLMAALTGDASWPDRARAKNSCKVLLVETEAFRGPYAERLAALGVPDEAVITPHNDPTFIPDFQKDEKLILETARKYRCGAISVDSLSGGHGLDENSAEMRRILRTLGNWAAALSIPLIACHHTRKKGIFESQRVTLDRIRGSSTITQFCRSVVGLWKPNPGPTKSVRVEVVKSNFCKPPRAFGFTISDAGLTFCEPPEELRDVTAVDKAAEFLSRELQESPQIYSALSEKAEPLGISKDSLYRAKGNLEVITVDGKWHLPGDFR